MAMRSLARLCLLIPALAEAIASTDSFHESLTLHPLPDGKLSVLFEFTTYFSVPPKRNKRSSHHSLTPPSLLLPLQQNNVSELTISFVAGQWDQERSGEVGPLHHETAGGGGEVRGWLRNGGDSERTGAAWTSVTHALGGLFCAGLGPSDPGDTVKTFGSIYPSTRDNNILTHYLLPHPFLHLCTENLTPFLSLLPSKGQSGLSHLLAQPGNVFSWGYKAEGIEVIMPDGTLPGRWTGWWEGVVDLVTEKGGSRSFSIESVFKRSLPRAFPEASESVLRVITPSNLNMSLEPHQRTMDNGKQVASWDLLDQQMFGKDIRFSWRGEKRFTYPLSYDPPYITVSKSVTSRHGSDGVFTIKIQNHGEARQAIYSEVWPWWVKGWMSEMQVSLEGIPTNELVQTVEYHPSSPPTTSTKSLHISLNLPAKSKITLTIPFSKLTIKYTEHRPDAERGVDIPAGVLTLIDGPRKRIYTNRLLLDVPTPDFSMPYNVIIMSCTVMAVFFGLMQGTLTRRWGWVETKG